MQIVRDAMMGKTIITVHLVAVAIIGSFVTPAAVIAQSGERHSTLLGWEAELRRFMLDRTHNYGGTHFERGLFRENIPPVTPEHEIDLMTYRFTDMDDYAWERAENGYRLYMGSLDAKTFAVENHLKTSMEVTPSSTFRITGVQAENFRAERFLVSLEFEKQWAGNHAVGLNHTISKAKGDLDAGLYYRYGNLDDGMIRVETTFLDWASNVTERLAHESENRYNDYDVIAHYHKRPQLYSLELLSPDLDHFRGEIVAGIQTLLDKTVSPDDTLEFRDREWAHYAGVLLEYYNPYLTAGITFKREFSKLKRNPLAGSSYEPEFGNWQFTNQYGIYASADVHKKIRVEQWLWYEDNTDRLQGDTVPEDLRPFDFVERRVKLKSRILYDNRSTGLKMGIEFHADYRYPQGEEIRGVRNRDFRIVYSNVRDTNERMSFTIGYRVSPHFYLLGGLSYDLDMDHISGFGLPRISGTPTWFDGGYGRLIVTW